MSCVIPIAVFPQPSFATLGIHPIGLLIVNRSRAQTPFVVTRYSDGYFYISGVNGEATYAYLDPKSMIYSFAQKAYDRAIPVKFRSFAGLVYFYDSNNNSLGQLAITPELLDNETVLLGIGNELLPSVPVESGIQFVNLEVAQCSPPGLFAASNGNGIVNTVSNGIPKIPLPTTMVIPNGTQRLTALGNGSITLPTPISTNAGTVCYPITDKISVCYKN